MGTIVCLSACLWEPAMRGMVILLVLVVGQTQPVISQERISGSPRVVLSINPRTTQRQVQLVGQGISTYPTVDFTCDGARWTLPLTRSEATRNRTTATYAVPEHRAGQMLRAAECRLLIPGQDIALDEQATLGSPEHLPGECRLLIPGQDIALARQQLRAWPSPPQGASHRREARAVRQSQGVK